jgi:hypothetical protein
MILDCNTPCQAVQKELKMAPVQEFISFFSWPYKKSPTIGRIQPRFTQHDITISKLLSYLQGSQLLTLAVVTIQSNAYQASLDGIIENNTSNQQ